MKEPILITGSHRSGTTWVGNIIRNLPRIYYLHEPLTPNSITRGLFNTEIWYKYYDPKKEYENIETILNELFSGSYPFKAMFNFKNSLPHTDYRNPNGINDGKIDPVGRLWFGTMDNLERKQSGSLYCLDKNLILHKVDDGYFITNGPAFINNCLLYTSDAADE